jgi:hypothetical protein
MKRIIKSALIALTIVCAISCSEKFPILDETSFEDERTLPAPPSPDDNLSYELKQKHYETWHQIEYYFGSDKEVHRIVDVNLVWLEFSSGYLSDSVLFEIAYNPQYTNQINCENPKAYLNTKINYDNGFKIGDSIVECSFVAENYDNLIISINDRNIEISSSELQYCPITPISLHINNVDSKYIYATLLIEIYHPDNVMVIGDTTSAVESIETIEIPVIIQH